MNTECPSCKQSIEADDQWAGTRVACPTCKAEFDLPPVQPQTSIAPPPVLSTQSPRRLKFSVLVSGVVAGIIILVGLTMLKLGREIVGTESGQEFKGRRAIEGVLKKDKGTSAGTTNIFEVVRRMRAIDTSGCPTDFREAYLIHVHAWESLGEAAEQARAFIAARKGANDFVEGFIRGFLGDPLGKVNETIDARNQLQASLHEAGLQVKETFNQVERIAVAHGARLPQK